MDNKQATAVAYIAIGSNMGNREQLLEQAIEHINQHLEIEVTQVSRIYETDPVGYTEQPAFLNMAIQVKTTLSPEELLREQLAIEQKLGRVREIRWGPRTIDLDLLMYDNVTLDTELLVLPHPRMMERAFVLVPLYDVLSKSHPLYEDIGQIAKDALETRKEGITEWTMIN